MALVISRDDNALEKNGIKILKCGYSFLYNNDNSCTIRIISEIEMSNSPQYRHKDILHFLYAIKNKKGIEIASGESGLWLFRDNFVKASLYYTDAECPSPIKDIKEIIFLIK